MGYAQTSLSNTTDELMSKSAELAEDIKKLEKNISDVDIYHRYTLEITKEDISTLQVRVTMLEKLLLVSNICHTIVIIGILILINL